MDSPEPLEVPVHARPRSKPQTLKGRRFNSRTSHHGQGSSGETLERATRSLVVDLHNSASFPTLAVGVLVGALREAGQDVEVLSPLAHDVVPLQRERREIFFDDWQRRLHLSRRHLLRPLRDRARATHLRWVSRPHGRVLRETARALERQPDVLVLSAYLRHFSTVQQVGRLAAAKNIPLLLGGPVFNLPEVAEAWLGIPGLTAIVGAEADISLPAMVEAVARGGDLLEFPGVLLPDGRRSAVAPPLKEIEDSPLPDYTDFPWDRYPVRIIPVLASRGCGWGRCTFCSDVKTAAGRTFRSRSAEAVLDEMQVLSDRHETRNFQFFDLKLNSSLAQWRGLIGGIPKRIPGALWIATVHVDDRKDNGLSLSDLIAARNAGLRRVSFGLESGSQRLLDAMCKGSRVEDNSRFIHDAHSAGLSVRCTMFRGFPGERAVDLELTAEFLEAHAHLIDRVRFNKFSLIAGTPLYQAIQENPLALPGLVLDRLDARNAVAAAKPDGPIGSGYHRALSRVLRQVHAINHREIRAEARVFDGLM
ncbi:MAG TPA: radical SAM protein [Planctomycetes bacterium]|nr:radical SAM protein [Planctomycetota bacterium]